MQASPSLLPSGKPIEKAERSELIECLQSCREMSNEWIYRQVIENNRIDILAKEVLGYEVKPFHLALMKFQFEHPQSLQLVYRGAGKSTICTVTKIIHLLLKNPNLRILIVSKSLGNAKGFLKEIKAHFESNERLSEIFGKYYDQKSKQKWDEVEVDVLPRTDRNAKEANITCVGLGSTIVSRHYDCMFSDDLVDEENSRTQHMRDKTRTWYYQTLDPCLEPPSKDVPHRGEHHHVGTRYHYADLWGHFIENRLKDHHQTFPAINKDGRTPWPERTSVEYFLQKREDAGLIIFNAQYQMNVETMKGEIFQYDLCQMINAEEVPKNLRIFIGQDLAIGEKETNDYFAQAVIGVDKFKNIYVLKSYLNRLRFQKQVEQTNSIYEEFDPVRLCIETVAYQRALLQAVKDQDVNKRIKGIDQHRDKVTRAWKLSALFEQKRVFFVKGAPGINEMISQLVLFPNHEYDDCFDALDLAVAGYLKKRRKRKPRRSVGVI